MSGAANRHFAAQQYPISERPSQPQKLPANCLTQDISCDGFTLWKPLAQRRRSAHGASLDFKTWHLVCQPRKTSMVAWSWRFGRDRIGKTIAATRQRALSAPLFREGFGGHHIGRAR